ncbi:MAG: EF-Tu/IF-2/RF-3 family GTPase, partial [Bdellovibrio sp.]
REARASEVGAKGHRPTLEQIMAKMNRGEQKDLPVILKADVAGSLEALQGMFTKLATQEVKPKILHTAIGGITESDVLLASTAQALIIGFNVRPDSAALNEAKRRGVEIRTYSIVYELVDDIKKAMAGLLSPEIIEKVLGRAEVRNTFSIPKIGTIAGCFVTDGKVQRNAQVRLLREGKIVYTGNLSSLKRFKDDAREVAQGFECGIGIENYNDVKVGDVMEIFTKEEVARELTPAPSLSP